MSLRAVPVCFLRFAEGLRLTFSHIGGITGQTTIRPSDSRPLALSLDSHHQTSITGRTTDPVGEEDTMIKEDTMVKEDTMIKEDAMIKKDTRIKEEGPKTGKGSETEEEKDSGGCCCVIV